jgi:hypothetical protein
MHAASVVPAAALGFGDSKIARRTGAADVNAMTLLRARVDIYDASDNHARVEHAQLADSAAADELSSGRKHRLAECFLQWAQSKIEIEDESGRRERGGGSVETRCYASV